MPNALVIIERNGVGTGCLSGLMKSRIKHNLYYEVKRTYYRRATRWR